MLNIADLVLMNRFMVMLMNMNMNIQRMNMNIQQDLVFMNNLLMMLNEYELVACFLFSARCNGMN